MKRFPLRIKKRGDCHAFKNVVVITLSQKVRAMAAKFTLTVFTPYQAEKITGLSVANQRDWRRRGYLKQNHGHARFDAFDLAEIMVLSDMSRRGIGPKDASPLSALCASAIVYYALRWIDAYEGDHMRAYEWNAHVYPEGISWGTKAEWLAKVILKERGYHVIPAPYFVWWANGSELWVHSLDKAFSDGVSDDPRWDGPVIVLSLEALGGRLIRRCETPIVHVEFGENPSSD